MPPAAQAQAEQHRGGIGGRKPRLAEIEHHRRLARNEILRGQRRAGALAVEPALGRARLARPRQRDPLQTRTTVCETVEHLAHPARETGRRRAFGQRGIERGEARALINHLRVQADFGGRDGGEMDLHGFSERTRLVAGPTPHWQSAAHLRQAARAGGAMAIAIRRERCNRQGHVGRLVVRIARGRVP